ncbi:MAG: hypothetical protein QXS20_10025 [Candidatus Thorarchaeota archaeon]
MRLLDLLTGRHSARLESAVSSNEMMLMVNMLRSRLLLKLTGKSLPVMSTEIDIDNGLRGPLSVRRVLRRSL